MADLRNDPSQQHPDQQQKNPAFKKKGFQKEDSTTRNLPDMDSDADTRQLGSETEEDYSGGSEGDSVRESSKDWDRRPNVGDDKRSQQNLNVRGNKGRRH